MARIPKLRRNGDGRAFVEVPNSGRKRVYLGQWGTSEAARAYNEWVAKLVEQRLSVSFTPNQKYGNITALVIAFLSEVRQKKGKRSREFSSHKRALSALLDLCGDDHPNTLGTRTLEAYKRLILKSTYKRDGERLRYSQKTLNDWLKVVKSLVRWACRNELIPADRYAALQVVAGIRQEDGATIPEPVRPIPFSLVGETLPYLPRPVSGMVQVQYYCGMRPAEVRKMRWEGLNTVGDIWLYTPEKHKNTHRGLLLTKAVPQAAQRVLREFKPEGGVGYIFRPVEAAEAQRMAAGASKVAVDLHRDRAPGSFYSSSGYNHAVKRALKKAHREGKLLEDWCPAQLRHSIATEIRARWGQEKAQNYLGHAHLDTTAIYAERSVREILKTAALLDSEVFSDSACASACDGGR